MRAGAGRAVQGRDHRDRHRRGGTDARPRDRTAREVLIKLTGRARLADSDPAKAVIARAPELIADYSYEDRMKDIPIHDEQGTRDRPHFLRMTFDMAKFDAALGEAGLPVWRGKRPTVAVWLGIREARGRFILSADGEGGYGQREVLKEASKRRAIPVILPPEAQNEVTYENIVKRNWSVLSKASWKLGATRCFSARSNSTATPIGTANGSWPGIAPMRNGS
ncbi:MAG: DUF2066 domain-containing protein [Rhodomicrobium sp.]|nr:DUF2066 domain-containing protein [Rhodomicrobium sp.]